MRAVYVNCAEIKNITTSCHRVITTRLRAIWYRVKQQVGVKDELLFPTEYTFHASLKMLCEGLHVRRDELFISCSSRGLVSGDVKITRTDGTIHDCRDTPFEIPGAIQAISNMHIEIISDARLLIVEKETILQRLHEAQFSCVEDGGVPSVVRRFGGAIAVRKYMPDEVERRATSGEGSVHP